MTHPNSESYESFFQSVEMAEGCQDCSAVQTLCETESGAPLYEIRHDLTCPAYRRIVTNREPLN